MVLPGSEADQHSMASGRDLPPTRTSVQEDLVRASWAMQAGEKTAVTLLRLRRREAPTEEIRSQRSPEEDREEEDKAMLSAKSWKVSNCHWKMNKGAANRGKLVFGGSGIFSVRPYL